MHASNAFMNGAADPRQLVVLNLLLAGPLAGASNRPADKARIKDREQAEKESHAEHANKPLKPGSFKNDPDDPTNPNEVRERSRRKSQ